MNWWTVSLTDWQSDSLVNWLIDLLIAWLTDWLIDWLFAEVTAKEIQAKYPNLTVDEIRDMRAQFQHYDVNNDGVLDFDELFSNLFIIVFYSSS